MVAESPEEIAKFLHLQTLTVEELLNEAKNQKITTNTNSKSELIELLYQGQGVSEKDIPPQGIPLRSKDKYGKSIPNAAETYAKWRKLIFNAQDNCKYFDLLNRDGKTYASKSYFIKRDSKTALYVLTHNWHSVYDSQKTLIEKIKVTPDHFNYNIIRKHANNGNNFLMLHCQLKED
tara:strand:- start:1234 stop:1764 length:531 start_codon:yes stop_codon:yes gene_type:complete